MSDYVINALTEASYSLQNFIAQPESIRKIHTAIDLLVKGTSVNSMLGKEYSSRELFSVS